MKLRFYPKTAVVKSYLEAKLTALKHKTDAIEADLEKAAQPRALYVDMGSLRTRLAAHTAEADGIQVQLDLLSSHGPEEVMMELDIA